MYLILWLLIIGKLSPIYDYVRFFFVLYRGGGRGGQGGEEGRGERRAWGLKRIQISLQ